MEAIDSRTAIKGLALDLLVRAGYRGMSFGAIAGALGVTRANIHYHFGSKAGLVDAVLAEYVEVTLARLAAIWDDEQASLADKLDATLAHSRERFRHFNDGDGPPRPWSLISRLRQDEELLTPAGRARLRHFTAELSRIFERGLDRAARHGELRPDLGVTPAAAATLFVVLADNAAPITMARNGFDGLAAAYATLTALVTGP